MRSSTPLRPDMLQRQTIMGSTSSLSSIRTDDEQESSDRQSIVGEQGQLVNIAPPTATFLEIAKFTEEQQINDHFKICNKLYSDNKITAKNAWELHIIDIINKITATSTGNVFQVACTSLDIGTTVYCCRVDDVYESGLKMKSTLKSRKENQVNNDEVSHDEPAEGELVKRGCKRKRSNTDDKKCTIDYGKNNILEPIKILDPPLFQIKRSVNVGATDNFFMYKLRTNPATHRLTLMSGEQTWRNDSDEILELATKVDVGMELPKPNTYTMLDPLKDFEITDWNPAGEEHQLRPTLDSVVLDAQGIPIAELDGSIYDIFSENNVHEEPISEVEEQAEEFQAQIHAGIEHIADAIPEDHRRAKSPTPVDFSKDHDWCEVYGKFVNKGSGLTTAPLEKILLADSFSDDYNRILTHFLSKRDVPRPKRLLYTPPNSNSEEREVQLHNGGNLNDSLYRAQDNTDYRHDNEPFHNLLEDEAVIAEQGNFLDENLVDAPALVTETHEPYALQAEEMDMEKLKAAMWKCLAKNKSTENIIERTQFSALCKKLSTNLTQEMKKGLSCPLAFEGLLHLCNENNLQLQQENLKDFTIMNAKNA